MLLHPLFAILQKYDFSSKSQPFAACLAAKPRCLRYCKSTIFQANHNHLRQNLAANSVVCDTAKVRFFKQITTFPYLFVKFISLFAILQKYDFSSKSQHDLPNVILYVVVCDTAKVRFFKQITTETMEGIVNFELFAILQKYDFSSKSQLCGWGISPHPSCLRYCKSTIFQANHN